MEKKSARRPSEELVHSSRSGSEQKGKREGRTVQSLISPPMITTPHVHRSRVAINLFNQEIVAMNLFRKIFAKKILDQEREIVAINLFSIKREE